MMRPRLILVLAALVTAAAPAGAQERGRGADPVPTAYRPPAGMCRIWLDGVPAGQQPAPTDCATAVRNRPSNGRVIFGDEPRDKAMRFKLAKPRGGDDVWDRRPPAERKERPADREERKDGKERKERGKKP